MRTAYANKETGDPGVKVTWENYATGKTGGAAQSADWGCDWFVCGWIHKWWTTIPLGLGENLIEVSAYSPGGWGARVSVTFNHPLTHIPKIYSTSAGEIQSNIYPLKATIEPGGLITSVWFDYGTDSNLTISKSTSGQTISATHDNQTLSFGLSSVVANTIYYFRAHAENSEGIAAGPIQKFSTYPPNSPIVQTTYASPQREGDVIFHGSVNPKGSTAQMWFEWDTDSSMMFPNVTPSQEIMPSYSTINTSQAASGLLQDTAYYFRAAATNSVMTRFGEVISFTTNPAPTVTTLDSEVLDNRNVILKGSVNPNGYSTYAWFKWGPDSDLINFQETENQYLGTGIDFVEVTQTIEDLSWGSTYYYRAVGNNLSRGEVLSFTVPQQTSSTWSRTYGGNGSEHINKVILPADGGYLVAGETDSFEVGQKDAWLIKLDENGNVQWQKTYGTVNDDSINSVLAMSDGGYIAIGKHSTYEFWILRLAADGSIEWQKIYGSHSDNDQPKSVIQTSDGGLLVIADISEYDGWNWYTLGVLKLRSDGAIEWQKAYGGGIYGSDVQETPDGDFVISGRSNYNQSAYISLLKIDGSGEIRWSRRYGTAIRYGLYGGYSLRRTPDGGYILAGTDELNVLKFSSEGILEWGNSYSEGVAGSVIPIDLVSQDFPLSMIVTDYIDKTANGIEIESKTIVLQQAP